MTTDKTITYSSASLRELSKTGIQLAKGQTLVMQDALVDPSTAFTLEAPPDVFETIQVPAKEDHTFGDVMSFGGLEDDEDDSKSYKFVVRADAPEKATFVIREKTMIGFPHQETVHEIPLLIVADLAVYKNAQRQKLVAEIKADLAKACEAIAAAEARLRALED